MRDNVILIFLDGVGIGEKNEIINPFFARDFRFLKNIFGDTPHLGKPFINTSDKYLFPVDARLGVEGIPQSGTGQTAIFTGINAAAKLGKHFGPYPHSELLQDIEKKSIFNELKSGGKKVTFLNAYPEAYFRFQKISKRRSGVISLSATAAGVFPKTFDDLKEGNGISPEIDNSRWIQNIHYDTYYVSPENTAKRLLDTASENDLTVYEYFLTDHIGHGRITGKEKEYLLTILDIFLYSVINRLKEDMTLLICSDHGNMENLGIKTHTKNPALAISAGKHGKHLYNKIESLTDIKEAILDITG